MVRWGGEVQLRTLAVGVSSRTHSPACLPSSASYWAKGRLGCLFKCSVGSSPPPARALPTSFSSSYSQACLPACSPCASLRRDAGGAERTAGEAETAAGRRDGELLANRSCSLHGGGRRHLQPALECLLFGVFLLPFQIVFPLLSIGLFSAASKEDPPVIIC